MAAKFYRSHDDKVIGGVCGGIAKYFKLDPTVVRIVTAALVIFAGIGLVVYIALWLLTPDSATGDLGADGVVSFYEAHRDRSATPPQDTPPAQ